MRENTVERRRYARVMPKGTVIVAAADHRQRGRVANISAGGMLATTSISTPAGLVGCVAAIDLRLDDRDAYWFKLRGKIQRVTADTVAVSFDETPPRFSNLLDELASAAHIGRRQLSVVLVDVSAERRATIAAGFRDNGCVVLEASTALEAIVRLGEAAFEPNVIAIADSIPSQTSEDLRRFVEREHPSAKLVTIGDMLRDPGGIEHWLSSADPDSDLVARVRRMLVQALRK
jgi:hypothetical protein